MTDKAKLTDTDPAIVGPYARAWTYGLFHTEATLASWVVHAPTAHPAWHSYMIAVVSLLIPVDGSPPVFYDPRATHEVMVFALDPAVVIYEGAPLHLLMPPNYMEQFTAETDVTAIAEVEQAVVDICNGVLSPDTDYARLWHKRFPFQNPSRVALPVDMTRH